MPIGGGFKAVRSVLYYAAEIGPVKLWRSLTSKNACKACAFGTGGQNGGLHNEAARGIEVCNKNIQAQMSDIRAGIPANVFLTRSINELSQLNAKALEDLGRLTLPLYKKAGDRHYSPLSYDEALGLVAQRLQATEPSRSFFYASGRSSNEAAFILQLFARLYGTNNVNNCSFYCHQASGVGLTATIGTATSTVSYDDLNQADCIFVWGANPASNHPRFVKTLIHARRRGAQVIVINLAKEPGLVKFASPSDWRSMLAGGAEIASEYLQPHLGGDIAVMAGIAKYLLDNHLIDAEFIAAHCDKFAAYGDFIHQLERQDIVREAGVARGDIERVAQLYSRATKTIFCWSMGLTHHFQGVGNIESLVALSLLRGQIGRPGAGLLPLRGHSNIQGTGSMGFTPQLKKDILQALELALATELPLAPGLDTMACMEAAAAGNMDVALMLGGNLLAANPDTRYATAALNNIGFKCYINTTLNMSHVLGVEGEVLILPIRARDEEEQPTTQESMFNFIRMSDGGIFRFPQLISEVDLITRLGKLVIPQAVLDFSIFTNHVTIRQWIAKCIPGFSAMEAMDSSKQEFTVAKRIHHTIEFHTANGRAQFKIHPLPHYAEGYRLTSVRSEGQFNSIIYHQQDSYRSQTERWVVLMNKADMKREQLRENDLVSLHTATGAMEKLKVKAFDVREGNLMVYYPEANILIPRLLDERSKTPGFKSVVVELWPC